MSIAKGIRILAISLTILTTLACHHPPQDTPLSMLPTVPPPPTSTIPAVDDQTLNKLALSIHALEPIIELIPGDTYTFTLGIVECCYFFRPVQADVTWSVTPTSGATIDPHTGVLSIDPKTPHGHVFTVQADVERGKRVLLMDVYVFTPEQNPLVGSWEHILFEGVRSIEPEKLIGELRFRADGTFAVTWHPFEVYFDYWGTYTFSSEDGSLKLDITGGNYIPENVDSDGYFSTEKGSLLWLKDVWLGNPPRNEAVPRGHDYVFFNIKLYR